MKKFKNQQIRDLLNQVYHEEISFSRMVEILNEMVSESEMSESEMSEFKDGEFLVNEVGDVLIFKKKEGDLIYDHAYLQKGGILLIEPNLETTFSIKRHATEEEKQELLDALAKDGKRWNAEKKCVEDIPEELKKGDLAIFWDDNKRYAAIKFYERSGGSEEEYFRHRDHNGSGWKNVLKFESVEQYEKLINGEI